MFKLKKEFASKKFVKTIGLITAVALRCLLPAVSCRAVYRDCRNGQSGLCCGFNGFAEKYGYLDNINPAVLGFVLAYDDKVIAAPNGAAILGLSCSIDLFGQAGLLRLTKRQSSQRIGMRLLNLQRL